MPGLDVRPEEIDQRLKADIQQRGMEDIFGLRPFHDLRQGERRAQGLPLDTGTLESLECRTVLEPEGGRQPVMRFTFDERFFPCSVGCRMFRFRYGRSTKQATHGVQGPLVFAQPLAAADMKAAVPRRQIEAQTISLTRTHCRPQNSVAKSPDFRGGTGS